MRNGPGQFLHEITFGSFRILAAERLLQREGKTVQIGARALDILIALVERAGEPVSKRELIAKVWPNATVDEGSLRFHIGALRKALGEGQAGARYVATLPGRGYCFVAPVFRSHGTASITDNKADDDKGAQSLPRRLKRMVGRDDTIKHVADQLSAERFVTIVGPGGIGKTTVAVAVGHALLSEFGGAVRFMDLGPLNDPLLVSSAIASALGLFIQSADPTPGLITFLRDKRMLLILDSCEHVIESAAALAEQIYQDAEQVHILATSRETLRVEGEQVYQLPVLACPPDQDDLTAESVLAFPAPQLFVERVAAAGRRFKLSDYDAPVVAEICRRLDGVALAIELAAGRVSAFGIQETAALLDNRFKLLWEGRRTALVRHQTLGATLDWSYDLLTERESVVLRRLSVFVGIFTLEAARFVATNGDLSGEIVVAAIANLVSKSLVTVDTSEATTRYRLLDTTRAYVLSKLVDSGEADKTSLLHATYYLEYLQKYDAETAAISAERVVPSRREFLGNVRAALEWSFFERGNQLVGAHLAAASVSLFLELSLLSECHRWTERAIATLDPTLRGTRCEMELQGALGLSLMFTRGNSERVLEALDRALVLSENLKDRHNELQILGRLHIFHERIGEFYTALSFALRGQAVAEEIGDPVGIAEAHSALGISRHLEGNVAIARLHLEAALVQIPPSQHIDTFHFGFDYRNRARITLARTSWLEGRSEQATALARETVNEAEEFDHPITLCIALIWAVTVALWNDDLADADEYIDRFIDQANRHSLAPYQAVGHGVKGELLIRRGKPEEGIGFLREALETLHFLRYELLTTSFLCAIAEGLMRLQLYDEALQTVCEAVSLVERSGDLFAMPELLRIKGEVLARRTESSTNEAELSFEESMTLAAAHGSLAWELRTATSLAGLLLVQRRHSEALQVLRPVVDRFVEGLDSAHYKAATLLLAKLNP